ncbi:MAG: FecR domain-containing protein [Chitinophagaceae bacterium]|nr:FecR domain-containing protein [Chitinophagaceae bacterium]
MEEKEFIRLAEKIADGTATDEEVVLYKRYCTSFAQKEFSWNAETGDKEATGKELNMRIASALTGTSKSLLYRLRPVIRVAASVILVIGVGFAVFKGYREREAEQPAAQQTTVAKDKDIAPGTDQAVLTLADGTTMVLDGAESRLIQQEGTSVRQQEGQLQYTVEDASAPVGNNTLTTSRGGQYMLTLPDGTRVWLNAASSFTYPTRFSGKERRVEIEGQAYFEVARNPDQPFIVKVKDATVKVLGTHFDIMSYPEEKEVQTTLVSGSVRVVRGKLEKIIAPGEQAFWNDGVAGALSVRAADIQQATAWKTGFFEFDNADLATIMRQIGRWYNVDIRYNRPPGDKTFGGRISRNLPLSQVLELLEANGARFRVEDKEITVL